MAQHTPGPWLYRPLKHDDWGWVRTQDGRLVAVARDSSVTDGEQAIHRRNRTDPYEGNARLIAAAPDLLGALRFLLAFYDPGQTHLDTNAWKAAETSARAAVAKAEGR